MTLEDAPRGVTIAYDNNFETLRLRRISINGGTLRIEFGNKGVHESQWSTVQALHHSAGVGRSICSNGYGRFRRPDRQESEQPATEVARG